MASTPYAHEIEAYSDAELNKYLDDNGRVIRVHDPKNLSDQFIQRLRDLQDPENKPPIDLDQVNAQLLQWVARRETEAPRASWSPPSSESMLGSEEQYIEDLANERKWHSELVEKGGRPWYPIELLETVSKNPQEHRELLRYWQEGPLSYSPENWTVFELQFGQWEGFQKWQEDKRRDLKDSMSKSNERARRQLARHSFTQPFEFLEDPKEQDQLTTWIEFMSYEYGFYDRFMPTKGQNARYDRIWNELVDSKVLRPNETAESIMSFGTCLEMEYEKEKAQKAVESAREAVQSALASTPESALRLPLHQDAVGDAELKLELARQELESIERWMKLTKDFCNSTSSHRGNKKVAKHHELLLQWIRDQIPLIELETRGSGGTMSALHAETWQNPLLRRIDEASLSSEAGPAPRHSHEKASADEEQPSEQSNTAFQASKAQKQSFSGAHPVASPETGSAFAEEKGKGRAIEPDAEPDVDGASTRAKGKEGAVDSDVVSDSAPSKGKELAAEPDSERDLDLVLPKTKNRERAVEPASHRSKGKDSDQSESTKQQDSGTWVGSLSSGPATQTMKALTEVSRNEGSPKRGRRDSDEDRPDQRAKKRQRREEEGESPKHLAPGPAPKDPSHNSKQQAAKRGDANTSAEAQAAPTNLRRSARIAAQLASVKQPVATKPSGQKPKCKAAPTRKPTAQALKTRQAKPQGKTSNGSGPGAAKPA